MGGWIQFYNWEVLTYRSRLRLLVNDDGLLGRGRLLVETDRVAAGARLTDLSGRDEAERTANNVPDDEVRGVEAERADEGRHGLAGVVELVQHGAEGAVRRGVRVVVPVTVTVTVAVAVVVRALSRLGRDMLLGVRLVGLLTKDGEDAHLRVLRRRSERALALERDVAVVVALVLVVLVMALVTVIVLVVVLVARDRVRVEAEVSEQPSETAGLVRALDSTVSLVARHHAALVEVAIVVVRAGVSDADVRELPFTVSEGQSRRRRSGGCRRCMLAHAPRPRKQTTSDTVIASLGRDCDVLNN